VDNDEGKSRRCQRARSAVSISSYIGGLYKKDGTMPRMCGSDSWRRNLRRKPSKY
jgi:hypothetical protein